MIPARTLLIDAESPAIRSGPAAFNGYAAYDKLGRMQTAKHPAHSPGYFTTRGGGGGGGHDKITGVEGDDTLRGALGNDNIAGDARADYITATTVTTCSPAATTPTRSRGHVFDCRGSGRQELGAGTGRPCREQSQSARCKNDAGLRGPVPGDVKRQKQRQ